MYLIAYVSTQNPVPPEPECLKALTEEFTTVNIPDQENVEYQKVATHQGCRN